MAQINLDGQQSMLLKDIKNVLRNGGNVTHILNVKVSHQPDNERGTAIRQAIFQQIANKPVMKQVYGVPVMITWRTAARTSSAYYYANVPLFTDIVVRQHSEQLLRDVLATIDGQFDNILTNGATGLTFMVTKPLMREIAIYDEDEDVDADEIDEEDERRD
jgi:hypothetical protein